MSMVDIFSIVSAKPEITFICYYPIQAQAHLGMSYAHLLYHIHSIDILNERPN